MYLKPDCQQELLCTIFQILPSQMDNDIKDTITKEYQRLSIQTDLQPDIRNRCEDL